MQYILAVKYRFDPWAYD